MERFIEILSVNGFSTVIAAGDLIKGMDKCGWLGHIWDSEVERMEPHK